MSLPPPRPPANWVAQLRWGERCEVWHEGGWWEVRFAGSRNIGDSGEFSCCVTFHRHHGEQAWTTANRLRPSANSIAPPLVPTPRPVPATFRLRIRREGALVWATLQGYPSWPAIVTPPRSGVVDRGASWVRFLGWEGNDRAQCRVQGWTERQPSDPIPRHWSAKLARCYLAAVEAAAEHLQAGGESLVVVPQNLPSRVLGLPPLAALPRRLFPSAYSAEGLRRRLRCHSAPAHELTPEAKAMLRDEVVVDPDGPLCVVSLARRKAYVHPPALLGRKDLFWAGGRRRPRFFSVDELSSLAGYEDNDPCVRHLHRLGLAAAHRYFGNGIFVPLLARLIAQLAPGIRWRTVETPGAVAARWQCKPAMSVCQLQVGRRVQALWASAWFEARVLATGRCEDEDEDQGKPCCLIHYIGWPKVWDEWIVLPSQRLRRQTDAVPVAEPLRAGSLFSGLDPTLPALLRAGLNATQVLACETDAKLRDLLRTARRVPADSVYEDVLAFEDEAVLRDAPEVDVLVFGCPCRWRLLWLTARVKQKPPTHLTRRCEVGTRGSTGSAQRTSWTRSGGCGRRLCDTSPPSGPRWW